MFTLPKMDDYAATRSAFRFDLPGDFNFGFDVVAARAREADKTAIVAVDRDAKKIEEISFSDLDRAANRFANMLTEKGAAKGDFAFVMVPRIPPFFAVMTGCIKTGVVAMPGTNLLTPKDIAYRVNKGQARIAIVTADGAAKVDEIRAECPSLEILIVIGDGGQAALVGDGWIDYHAACAAAPDVFERSQAPALVADDVMVVFFTSGTTAHPKMVPQPHSYAAAHAITGRYWMDLEESDVHWTLSDTGWAKAAWGLLFGPLMNGAATVLYDADMRFDAETHLGLIGRLGVTTFCAPPTIYRLFAQMDLGAYDLTPIRHSISAGEPLNPEVIRVWKGASGTTVHDGYGQSESVNIVANYPCVPVRPGSMGMPVPGMKIGIIDDDGTEMPQGEVGQVAVATGDGATDPWPPGLFRGYYQDDAANAYCFRGGWYYTGDTAYRDEDGYIWFVGRADDLISSAGYRISPFEVESALVEHPAVAEAAVVGKPDEMRGEIVKAFVTLAPGQAPSDELAKEIQDFVKAQTAPYKYPREIEFREALPKTISGKIRRVELRAEARGE